MARTQTIAWPDDQELLTMVKDHMSALQIAGVLDCSRDSVREKLRQLGCKPDFKGHWVLPNDQPQAATQPKPTGKAVLEKDFPFIQTRKVITSTGQVITMPHLSILATFDNTSMRSAA